MVKPRLAPILVTQLTKPNGSRASLQKVDYQYFVHILFTTQSMIRYCRIYMYIFLRLYLPSMSKLFIKNRHIAQLGILGIKVMQKWPSSNAKKRGMKRILSECYILWNNKLGILAKGSSVSATLILLSGGILTPFFYQTPRLR